MNDHSGSPFSFTNMAQAAFPSAQVGEVLPASSTLTLNAGNGGYSPRTLYAVAGEPVLLNVVTQKTYSCSRDFVIPALGVQILLPETGTVPIDIPPQPAGTVMRFTCSMGMYTGVIVFSLTMSHFRASIKTFYHEVHKGAQRRAKC